MAPARRGSWSRDRGHTRNSRRANDTEARNLGLATLLGCGVNFPRPALDFICKLIESACRFRMKYLSGQLATFYDLILDAD